MLSSYDKIIPVGIMQMGVYNNLELTNKIYRSRIFKSRIKLKRTINWDER